MKDIIVALFIGIMASYLVARYFNRKEIKRIRRRLSFPTTPADLLAIAKNSFTSVLGKSETFGGHYSHLANQLYNGKYNQEDIDSEWITKIYKKEKKGDWVWRICPRCSSESIYKSIRYRSDFKFGIITKLQDGDFCFLTVENIYNIKCKDCGSQESNWQAKIHAEAIERYSSDKALDEAIDTIEEEMTEEALKENNENKQVAWYNSFLDALEYVLRNDGKIIKENSLNKAVEKLFTYRLDASKKIVISIKIHRRLNVNLFLKILLYPFLVLLEQKKKCSIRALLKAEKKLEEQMEEQNKKKKKQKKQAG